jgi:hypothetical protein
LAPDEGERTCAESCRPGASPATAWDARLMMKALCMRLMHLGLDAHVWGT